MKISGYMAFDILQKDMEGVQKLAQRMMDMFNELSSSSQAANKPKCLSYALINFGATAFMAEPVRAQAEFKKGLETLHVPSFYR